MPDLRLGRFDVRSWIPTFLWLGVILFLSTGLFSEDHTGKALGYLVGWLHLPLTVHQVVRLNHIVRKLAHISEYAVLSIFAFRSLQHGEQRWRLRSAAGAVLLCALVAVFDEGFQAFMPHRGGLEARDVVLDTAGAFLAQLLLLGVLRLWPGLPWVGGRGPQPASGAESA